MKKITCIVFTVALVSTGFSQNINLTKGQKYSVDNKTTLSSAQTFMGQSIETNAEVSTKYSIAVKGIQNDNYTLESIYTKMKGKMSAMGNEMNFDSDKKEDMEAEMAASFKELINKPKEVVIDKWGKIISIKKDETTTGTAQPEMMKMMVSQLVGDPEETGYGAKVAFVSIPSTVTPGYSWSDSSSKEGVQRMTTYTIKEIKGNDVVVNITGYLNSNAISQMQGMDILNKSTGNLKGEQTIDIATGVIKERSTTLESIGTLTIQGQGVEIPTTSRLTLVTSVKASE